MSEKDRLAEAATSGISDTDRERLYLETLQQMERELRAAREELRVLRKEVRKLARDRAADRKLLRSQSARIQRLRLDRQLLELPRWLVRRVRRGLTALRSRVSGSHGEAGSLILVAPKYPSAGDSYGGQPVQRRVRYYLDAGLGVSVFVPSSRERFEERPDGARVMEGRLKALPNLIESEQATQLGVHHPTPDTWEAVKPYVGTIPTFVWIHGYEARDWRTLAFNYSAEELETLGPRLDAITIDRQVALAEIFRDDRVVKIFVSDFMKEVAEEFAECRALNSRVIHNVIDTHIFSYKPKDIDQRRRILVVRSFTARNYATDLVAEVIHRLAGLEEFSQLQFTIRGDGKHFEEDTDSLRQFGNVSIERGVVGTRDLAQLHADHGVMLLPTRWDSQGMTMGEAMASGLVVVTNEVAAIPEFADASSALLVPAEDVDAMADAIVRLYHDPALFADLSTNAAKRSAEQCGPDATVRRELELLSGGGPAEHRP